MSWVVLASLLSAAVSCNSPDAPPRAGDRALTLVENVPAGNGRSTGVAVNEDLIRADVFYLASKRLEGRGVGTDGLELAADFVATRFEALGLKPLPALGGYFQPFEMTAAETIGDETYLASGEQKYKLNDQFIALKMSAEKAFAAPVVFAGYGITNEGYDDYEGIDAKGKVVLVMRYEPHDPATGQSRWAAKDEEWSNHAHLETKAKNAAEHGAAAIVLVNPPLYHDHGMDPLLTFDRSAGGAGISIPVLQTTRAIANQWLKRGGLPDLKQLQERIDKEPTPASAELKDVSVQGKVSIHRSKRPVKNVVAYLPGSGPNANEYVVIGAHYDHLGYGGRSSLQDLPLLRRIPGVTEPADPKNPHGDPHAAATRPTTQPATQPASRRAIHHGADDNASGTAAMLELARVFAQRAKQGDKPARTLIFTAFTAEESGLLGSAHFTRNPPIDLKQVVAMLNLDMVGRIRSDLLYVGGGGTALPFEGMLAQVDRMSPLDFKNFGKGGLGPSDHMSFALKKVPVIFFFSGTHMDYHRITDTAEKINYDGIEKVVEAASAVVNGMTRMPKSQYVDASDKSTMFNPMSTGPGTPGGGGTRRASLGVVPQYGEEEDGKGVKIGGATEGSPAEKAGLKSGDVVLQLGTKPTTTLLELSQALAAHKPGDKVTLKYQRDGKVITIEVTLSARGG